MWWTTSFPGLPGVARGSLNWTVTQCALAQEGPLKLTDKRRSLKRKENWRKLLLFGIQTDDKFKLTKPPFFVAYSRLCRHCHNLAEGGCHLSRFNFYVLSLIFGSCRLSEFTLAGRTSKMQTADWERSGGWVQNAEWGLQTGGKLEGRPEHKL